MFGCTSYITKAVERSTEGSVDLLYLICEIPFYLHGEMIGLSYIVGLTLDSSIITRNIVRKILFVFKNLENIIYLIIIYSERNRI